MTQTPPEPLELSPAVQLNINLRGLPLSATLEINERSAALQAEGREVFRLGLGQSPFPVPDRVRQALADNAHQKDYLPVQGLHKLRASICGYLKRTQDLDFDPEDILVGPGTKELMFLVQMAYYGDLVIPTPSWVSYAPQAHILGRPITWLPTEIENGLGVTGGALRELCSDDPARPRLMIINSPGNPTGTAYAPEALDEIAGVARDHRVLVLSDEIYGGVQFDGQHASMARHYRGGTIISDGLSKWAGAGGWRLGFFAFPKSLAWLRQAMASAASETYTSVSAPIQHAACVAFDGGEDIEAYLAGSRTVLAALADYVSTRLTGAGAELNAIRGGFYAFPNFERLRDKLAARGITDSRSLCSRMLDDTGVATLPGIAFGRPQDELSLRLAFVDFDGGPALEAVAGGAELDRDGLRKIAPNVIEAIDRMTDWIAGDQA